jgi:cation diffusion facilitator family transporter
MAEESAGTVVLALTTNLVLAVAKTAAGVLSQSSSMISEAAHSWADTLNQVFLLASLRTSKRPPDPRHPFGYGKERFFWALLAAVGIFVTGGMFSVWEGVGILRRGGQPLTGADVALSYAVLALSMILEGTSLARAARQTRREARAAGRGFVEQVRRGNDPTVKTVLSEDGAAVTGVLLAAAGLGLHWVTGSAAYDASASIAIGLLLIWIAFALGKDTKDLLIGEAADPELRLDILGQVSGYPEVDAVLELMTMQLGPDQLLVAVKVDLADDTTGTGIEDVSTRIEEDLSARFPQVRHVFLDATRPRGAQRLVAEALDGLPEPGTGPAH